MGPAFQKQEFLSLQCRSQMPKFQRKARDAPFCSGFNGLRQLLSRRLLVTTSQVSASTHPLSQGIGWQPFRGSGRNKKHLQVQHCQQKPSRSQDTEWQGSSLAQRGKPVGAVGHGLPLVPWLLLPAHLLLPAGSQKLHPSWHCSSIPDPKEDA